MNRKRSVKAQITLFIIMGLGIILTVGLFIYIRSQATRDIQVEAVTGIAVPIKNFVDGCIKQTAEGAISFVGVQGGYYPIPPQEFSFINFDIPIYAVNGTVIEIPSRTEIQDSLSDYMSDNLKYCIRNFDVFAEQGFNITYGYAAANATLGDKSVTFNIYYPLAVQQGEAVQSLSRFSATVGTSLPKLLIVAQAYMAAQQEAPNQFRFKHIMDLSQDNDVIIETLAFPNNIILFSIVDPDTQVRGINTTFMFAIQYEWQNVQVVTT